MMLRVIFLVISLCLLIPASWAGDQMNIEFLTHHAIKNDLQLQKMNEDLKAELYGPPGRMFTVSSLLMNGLWGASLGITSTKGLLAICLPANGLWAVTDIAANVMETKHSKRVQAKMRQIQVKNNEIEDQVKRHYSEMREGSVDARLKLVEMTNEESVAEVQRNIEMEDVYQKLISKPSQEAP